MGTDRKVLDWPQKVAEHPWLTEMVADLIIGEIAYFRGMCIMRHSAEQVSVRHDVFTSATDVVEVYLFYNKMRSLR